jgi:hypothetical protein
LYVIARDATRVQDAIAAVTGRLSNHGGVKVAAHYPGSGKPEVFARPIQMQIAKGGIQAFEEPMPLKERLGAAVIDRLVRLKRSILGH